VKILLHGEDTSKLYARELALLQSWRGEGKSVRTLDCAKQKEPELLETLGSQSMFAPSQVWHLKHWEKLRSPKLQTSLLELLNQNSDDVLMTVPQEMSAAQKKKVPAGWKLENFPMPVAIFKFLESIKAKPYSVVHDLFRQTLATGNEWGLHTLLSRQFRYMLQAKVGAPVAGPPFIVAKVKGQAQHFTEAELLGALKFLFELERGIKQGKYKHAWSTSIDILLGRLYDDGH
jgi:DNA polymerase III delta subunit